MKLFTAPVFGFLASWAYMAGAVRVPGADTPLFYLVSTSASSSPNLKPLQTSGGTGSFAALGGGGPIGKLYFYQGRLVAQDPAGGFSPAYINATPSSSECTTFGPLGFGSGSNKCALSQSFELQSDTENSQLGARLVFNNQGGFVACGTTQDIWYITAPGQGPSGCTPVDLYTVPVEA